MTRKRLFLTIFFLAGVSVASVPVTADDSDVPPLSPAQIALFESDHLKSIQHPDRLEYRFARDAGSGGRAAPPGAAPADPGSYTDRIDLDVRPRPDEKKDVWVDFLTGDRHMPFPPMIGFRGNPVLMFFLEHDVEEMERVSGGTAGYFRTRIRQAFVDRAQLKEIDVTHDGTESRGTEITLKPFTNDPRISMFPELKDKQYRFVLTDAVPGSIYEIDAETEGAAGQKPPVKESMVFVGEHPCAGSEGPCDAPAVAQ
jgi:hypothetical protein